MFLRFYLKKIGPKIIIVLSFSTVSIFFMCPSLFTRGTLLSSPSFWVFTLLSSIPSISHACPKSSNSTKISHSSRKSFVLCFTTPLHTKKDVNLWIPPKSLITLLNPSYFAPLLTAKAVVLTCVSSKKKEKNWLAKITLGENPIGSFLDTNYPLLFFYILDKHETNFLQSNLNIILFPSFAFSHNSSLSSRTPNLKGVHLTRKEKRNKSIY